MMRAAAVIKTESIRGRIALMVAHCAGMIDLVALPIWVGTLIAHHGFNPQQAGVVVTLFLGGAVAASLLVARLFPLLSGRRVAPIGYAVAAIALVCASSTRDFGALAGLHATGGFAAGISLSLTHGTIGRTVNPHRLFALVGMALGIFAPIFMVGTLRIVGAFGGQALFYVLGGIMALAAIVCCFAFPQCNAAPAREATATRINAPMPRIAWAAILGISCITLVQAMMFSFVERMGIERGFDAANVASVLVAVGVVNMFPAALAGWLQGRLNPRLVLVVGPVLQCILSLVITQTSRFEPYAVGAAVFVAVLVFTHTFAFGLLAEIDSTGRATSATPAMTMIGSAIGPVLGGTLVVAFGYGGLGIAAAAIDGVAIIFFSRLLVRRRLQKAVA
ncbi:MFS transporter [Variovorax sp. J22P271]|uniref:MFS transporter n=1 Tax=Variovorax davisae TaxID=3053515 RepID=UPI0025779B78|nr:MFS transporter [Variovorax sp. J22P271]MDM0032419.1 MFS transporter [Variovorax sp. J22P271]